MSVAYALHYANDGYSTLAIEERFSLPLYDPSTDKPMDPLPGNCHLYSGIIDAVLRRSGLTYIADHKTASKVDDDYWRELKTNPQLTRYWMAMQQSGHEVSGFLWDVVQKPGISPKKLTKAAKVDLEQGSYCGLPCEGYSGEEEETPKMYGLRVLADYQEQPARFFHRRIIQRTPDDVLEYLQDSKHYALAMAGSYDTNKPSLRRRNLHACKSFNRICDFHSLCSGEDPEQKLYEPKESAPEDRKVEGISESRVACLSRCPREHQFRYLDKIQLKRRTYSEPLTVGSLVHEAIEIFLRSRWVPENERIHLGVGNEVAVSG